MAVKLSSLRVDASLDASGYTRGAGQKVDADARMIASDKAFAASQAQMALAMGKNTDAITRLDAATRQGNAWVDVAAKVYLAKTAYDALITSAGIAGTVTDTVFKGVAAGIAYLPNKVGEIWQEGTDKLTEYAKVSADAGRLSTDFYQHIVKGAADAKTSTDSLLAVVGNLNSALDRKLGGSTFESQIAALQVGGNLQGQRSQVADVNSASTPEAQFAASAKLIQSAMESGERLVALDLTKSLWGDDARNKLAENSDYIYKITTAVNSVRDAQIIAQPQIDRAVGLRIELENANKTLTDIYAKNKSTASDWSATGIAIQEVWVGVVSGYATSLSWLDKNVDALEKWLGLNAQVAKVTPQNSLASQLQNPQNVRNAMAQAQRIDDTFDFKPPDHKAIDQATVSIQQYVDATRLATSIVGLSAASQAQFKIEAQLNAAAIKDGLDPAVEQLTARYSLLRQQAVDAAAALESVTKFQAGKDALAAKFVAGEAGYKSAQDNAQEYIDATNLAIKFHNQAGALKEAQVNATLLAAALKAGRSGESPEDFAKAKQAGALAAQLAGLNASKDAFDRAQESLIKNVETTKAASLAIDQNVGEQERLKAVAQLTAAGIRDGLTPAMAAAKAEANEWTTKAGDARLALEKLQITSQINFGRQTAFLSPEDVQIAQKLKGLYPDVAEALGASDAVAVKPANALSSRKAKSETENGSEDERVQHSPAKAA
jgi:hypothetical protein